MKEVPIWEKSNLSLEDAAAYSGIGLNKLRDLTNEKNCRFVLWVGNKRQIKRRLIDQFIEQMYSIRNLWCERLPEYGTIKVSYQGSFHYGKEFDNVRKAQRP